MTPDGFSVPERVDIARVNVSGIGGSFLITCAWALATQAFIVISAGWHQSPLQGSQPL